MSTQLIKAAINMFIVIAIIVSVVQDIGNVRSPASVSEQQQKNQTISQAPEIAGVVVKVSDNLMKPVSDLLKAEDYNVKIEGYDFEGNDWWWEAAIKYGHILIVYTLFGKYQSATDGTSKRRLIMVGCVVLLLWFTVLPKYKIDRLKVEVKGKAVYESTQVVPGEIVAALGEIQFQELDNLDASRTSQASDPAMSTKTQMHVEEEDEFGDE